MKRLIVTLIAACVPVIAAAQLLVSPPRFVPTVSTSFANLFQYCISSNGGQGVTAPCTTTGAAPTVNASTAPTTTVVRFNAFPTIPPTATQLIIKFFGPTSSNFLLSNVCVGPASGTKQYDFTTVAGTCNGSNGCTKLCGSGTTACSNIPTTGLTLSGTVPVSAPYIIAFDNTSGTFNRSYTQLNSAGSSTFNYFPASTIASTQYNSYRKGAVTEACTTVKQASYTPNESLSGKNVVEQIAQVQVQ